MTLVTTITKFKAKLGLEDQLIDALRSFDNTNSISWQILSLGDNEYAALNTYESIENRSMDVVSGLDWLDDITPILELYEDGSRTQAFCFYCSKMKKHQLVIMFLLIAACCFSYYVSSLKFTRFDNFLTNE